MLAGGKDFDGLCPGLCRMFQQSRMQTLVQEEMRGQNSQHGR
jgi:hypothetical protein